jgi:2-keto-4-pentenoate hydratase/2-oxohepta-3-ene-1,7-dioic acid hydratase in catechol pathway
MIKTTTGDPPMTSSRRHFLKTSAISGAALAAPLAMQPAQAAVPVFGGMRVANPEMAKGMTVLNYMEGTQVVLGVKTQRGILRVGKAAQAFSVRAPATTDDLIQNGDQGLGKLVAQAVAKGGADLFVDESKIEFAPAVSNPEKIICVGLNYAKHAKETNNPIPKLPILFNKFNNTLNAHNGTVKVSSVNAEKFDYEAELVIVMGKRAANVSEAEALSYVFGYATGQDFTARDLQQRSSQWMIGKTNDGFGPIGPYVLPKTMWVNPTSCSLWST